MGSILDLGVEVDWTSSCRQPAGSWKHGTGAPETEEEGILLSIIRTKVIIEPMKVDGIDEEEQLEGEEGLMQKLVLYSYLSDRKSMKNL